MLANQFKSKVSSSTTCIVNNLTIDAPDLDPKQIIVFEAPDNTVIRNGDQVKVSICPSSFKISGRRVALVGTSAFTREERWLERTNT